MSTQYNTRIVYGFPASHIVMDGKGEEFYLSEWLTHIGSPCEEYSAGHYDRDPDCYVGTVIAELRDFAYSLSSMRLADLTVSDKWIAEVERVRRELSEIHPVLVHGDTGFYLMGEAS